MGTETRTPRILVKAPNWVGDCVMATPAIAYLREVFPEAQIDALVRRGAAGVLLDNPHLNSVIVGDERSLDKETRARLASRSYDAAAVLPNSFGSAWTAWRLGVAKRVGFARGGRSLLLSHAIPFERYEWQTPTPRRITRKGIQPRDDISERWPRHMVHYYLRVAGQTALALGVNKPLPGDDSALRLHLPLNPDACRQVDEILGMHGLASSRVLVGINPGAAYGGAKRWSARSLAEVADSLAASRDARIVCTASPGERMLTDEVERAANTHIFRLGEEVNLPGLSALIARLSVLVTNDSGAMHIAAAVGTPIVAVFGPTDWNVTRPWSSRAVVVRNSPDCAPCFERECPIDHRCMTGASTDVSLENQPGGGSGRETLHGQKFVGVTANAVLAAVERILQDAEDEYGN